MGKPATAIADPHGDRKIHVGPSQLCRKPASDLINMQHPYLTFKPFIASVRAKKEHNCAKITELEPPAQITKKLKI